MAIKWKSYFWVSFLTLSMRIIKFPPGISRHLSSYQKRDPFYWGSIKPEVPGAIFPKPLLHPSKTLPGVDIKKNCLILRIERSPRHQPLVANNQIHFHQPARPTKKTRKLCYKKDIRKKWNGSDWTEKNIWKKWEQKECEAAERSRRDVKSGRRRGRRGSDGAVGSRGTGWAYWPAARMNGPVQLENHNLAWWGHPADITPRAPGRWL